MPLPVIDHRGDPAGDLEVILDEVLTSSFTTF